MVPSKALGTLLLMASLSSASPVLADLTPNPAPAGSSAQGSSLAAPLPPPSADPLLPVPRDRDYEWMKLSEWNRQHEENVAVANLGEADLVFVGDSITAALRHSEAFKLAFADCKVANLGIGGDKTQNVLWRLEHGETGKLHPKLVSVLIGTNNIGLTEDDLNNTVKGVKAVVNKLHKAFPHSKILIVGIFPRGESASDPVRAKVSGINQKLSKLADDKTFFFRDIGNVFLEKDGTLPSSISVDHLHLTEAGMQRWADAISPTIHQLMK